MCDSVLIFMGGSQKHSARLTIHFNGDFVYVISKSW